MSFPGRKRSRRTDEWRALRVALCIGFVSLVQSAKAAAQSNPKEAPLSIEPAPLAPPLPAPSRWTPAEQGFTLALRVGYGAPFGAAAATDDGAANLDRAVTGTVPVELSFGYRFTPRFHASLAVQYAAGLSRRGPAAACPDDPAVPCHVHHVRGAIGIEVHILPAFIADPWLGLGMGYEYLRVGAGAPEQGNEFQGIEYANLHAGVDFRLVRGLRLGPFFTATIGRFDLVQPIPTDLTWSPITNKALHEWLYFGVRVKYLF